MRPEREVQGGREHEVCDVQGPLDVHVFASHRLRGTLSVLLSPSPTPSIPELNQAGPDWTASPAHLSRGNTLDVCKAKNNQNHAKPNKTEGWSLLIFHTFILSTEVFPSL